ncbi:VG15 protein [Streptomyces virginiae]
MRAAQNVLTRLLVRDIRGLRRLIRPDRLQDSVPVWMSAVRALIEQYGAASAVLASDFYERQRASANVPGHFDAEAAPPAPDEQVENSLRWATKDLWETDAEQEAFDVRLAQAEQRAEAVAQKLVADQGRATTRQAVDRDREAVAYARAAALGGCAFCKLMASRGAVYKNARTAGRDANEKFTGDASVVKFHDNCHCVIVPVFRGQQFELSAHAAEWDRIYREFAAPYPGDQLRRFRRALADNGHLPVL